MNKTDLKIGITLSGGGVRAAVFHLGVLDRLADEELLEKIEMTSTVSGGTLITGMLYTANKFNTTNPNNQKKWPTSQQFKAICVPFIKKKLTQNNLGMHALVWTILAPWRCISGRAKVLSKSLEKCWGIEGKLNDIGENPQWHINSCAIESGKNWRFIPNRRMGDYLLHYVNRPDIPLAEAICSSAAVPFLIGSLILKTNKYKWFKFKADKTIRTIQPKFKRIHIWDGGVYDNLGLEALVKIKKGCVYKGDLNFLIISDAAQELQTDKVFFLSSLKRLLDITMDQVRSLRARTLMDHFLNKTNSGVYLKIGNSVKDILQKNNWQGDKKEFAKGSSNKNEVKKAKSYSTDLWKMSEKNFALIFKHGWEVADATLVSRCPDLFLKQEYKQP